VLALAAASIGTVHVAWCVLHVACCVGPCNRRIGTTSSRSDNSERRMSIRCGAAALRAEGMALRRTVVVYAIGILSARCAAAAARHTHAHDRTHS
jgi:hypothetical protein